MGKTTAQNVGYSLQIRPNGKAAFIASSMMVSDGPIVNDNAWHHIAAVVDRKAGKASLYVDGVLASSQPTPPVVTNNANLVIGGLAATLDQVAVWDRALLAEDVAALYASPAAVKLPVSLTQRGEDILASTWRAVVPTGLEGQYQIDLHAFDLRGNRKLNPDVWRGVIDTAAPRVSLTARPTGAERTDNKGVRRVERGYVCIAEDRALDDTSLVCSNKPSTVQFSRSFANDAALQALFPDLSQRTGLSAAYFLWEPATLPAATVRACDIYNHCTTANAQTTSASGQAMQAMRPDAAAAALPLAVVLSPANERVVTATGALTVELAAESAQPLKQIVLKLDGTTVQTISFEQAEEITQIDRQVSLPGVAEGEHTLVALATDWVGNTQATTFPVTFSLDRAAPQVTLDATARDAGDTYQLGSGMMRFDGTASDTIGLATVQVRVGDGPFADVEFAPDGTWQTAQWLGFAPEGQEYVIGVRAVDLAGRVTEIERTVKIDIAPVPLIGGAAPTTAISSGPAVQTTATTARFVFGGADDTTSADTLAFECRRGRCYLRGLC